MIEIKAYPLEQGWEGKEAYFRKDGEEGFVGIHAIGDTGEDGKFHNMEAWLNLYDANKKFICSQSRIFGPLEEVAEDLIQDGWQVVTDWKV